MKPLQTTAALSIFALTMLAMPPKNVQAGCLKGDSCCKISCCPKCDHTCHTCSLEAELVDVEKKCFEVETKVICIPRVVFPWQKKQSSCNSCDSCDGRDCTNCVHNGAKIRKIKVLKTKKYTCPECKYTWTPEETASCCSGCCDSSGSDSGCCESGGCDGLIYEHVMPHHAAVPTPARDAMHFQHASTMPEVNYNYATSETNGLQSIKVQPLK